MRLVSLLDESPRRGDGAVTRTGLVVGDEVVDLTDPAVGLPGDMVGLLSLEDAATDALLGAASTGARRLPMERVRLAAPVPRPRSFLAIARNYEAHLRELGHERPEYQTSFSKQSTCVIGPGEAIEVPRVSATVDYEGELGLVIGRRCRHVPAEAALGVVAGATVVNDVSVREWQWRTPTMMMGKGFDTHWPTGPWVVTLDEAEDLQDLFVRTWVNGELRQDGTTGDMLFTCGQMIEFLSAAFTLLPGTVIATGTPAGVAAGEDPRRWLAAGDTVTVEVAGVGRLTTPLVDEPAHHRTDGVA